jgi:hypothetical protein
MAGLLDTASRLWNAGSSLKKAEKPKQPTGVAPVDQLGQRGEYNKYADKAATDGQMVMPYDKWLKMQQGLLAK